MDIVKMYPIFRSAMYCTVDLISDFVMNYIVNQGFGSSWSYIMMSSFYQDIRTLAMQAFWMANCLSRTQTCLLPFFPEIYKDGSWMKFVMTDYNKILAWIIVIRFIWNFFLIIHDINKAHLYLRISFTLLYK